MEEHIDKIIGDHAGSAPALRSPGFRETAIQMTKAAGALPRASELELAAIWYELGRASVASSEEMELIVQALRRMESQLLFGTRAATLGRLADRLEGTCRT